MTKCEMVGNLSDEYLIESKALFNFKAVFPPKPSLAFFSADPRMSSVMNEVCT